MLLQDILIQTGLDRRMSSAIRNLDATAQLTRRVSHVVCLTRFRRPFIDQEGISNRFEIQDRCRDCLWCSKQVLDKNLLISIHKTYKGMLICGGGQGRKVRGIGTFI